MQNLIEHIRTTTTKLPKCPSRPRHFWKEPPEVLQVDDRIITIRICEHCLTRRVWTSAGNGIHESMGYVPGPGVEVPDARPSLPAQPASSSRVPF